MKVVDRLRARRLARAELDLADAEHHYEVWVRGWGAAPSRVHDAKRRIERARKRVEKLSPAEPDLTTGRGDADGR